MVGLVRSADTLNAVSRLVYIPLFGLGLLAFSVRPSRTSRAGRLVGSWPPCWRRRWSRRRGARTRGGRCSHVWATRPCSCSSASDGSSGGRIDGVLAWPACEPGHRLPVVGHGRGARDLNPGPHGPESHGVPSRQRPFDDFNSKRGTLGLVSVQ